LPVARRLAEDIGASLTYCPRGEAKETCFALTFPLNSTRNEDKLKSSS